MRDGEENLQGSEKYLEITDLMDIGSVSPQPLPDKKLKFAVLCVGAECVGKTALARWIHNMLCRSGYAMKQLLNEAARSVAAESETKLQNLRVDPEAVNRYQKQVFHRQLEEERRRGFAGYVADRSLADNLAYLAEYGTGLARLLDEESKAIDSYKAIFRRQLVVHITPQREIYNSAKGKDDFRALGSWESIIRIDSLVKLFLSLWRIPNIRIDTPNMSERVVQVETALSYRGVICG